MKKLKYQTKFVLYHIGIMLLIILTTVGYFYVVVVGEMREKEMQNFQIITEKTATQLDSLFYEMDRAALQIAANPDIVGVFQSLPQEIDENYFTGDPMLRGELKKLLESYNFKNNGHARICLYNKYNDFICTSNRAITNEGIVRFFKGEAFEEVRDYFSGGDRYVYFRKPGIDVLASGEKQRTNYLAVVREIKDYYLNSSRCGYIEVQESTEKLDNILSDFGPEIRSEILDGQGTVIYRASKDGDMDFTGVYELSVPLKYAPYTVKFYKNTVEYDAAMNRFYLILVTVVIITMIVAVLLEKILVRHLSKPFVNLDQSMKSITVDNLHIEITDEESTDVVRRLEDSFNAMLAKLKDSMQNQITAKTNEVKSHLFALQSQMNPHFLHNILAIISMESQMDGNVKIPDICRRLGEILRYNAQMGDGYSTIEKECIIAEDYMQLMKVRYEELFEYIIEIDDVALKQRIPKLIIQPLCENCFQHGFKNVEPTWRIRIHVWNEENKWFIKVQDNGSGFSEDFLEKFQKEKESLDRTDIKKVLENISIGGLCIPNIYTRMKIIYGNKFVCRLFNDKEGATVLLGGEMDVKNIDSRG